jgi:hypothetical protein
MVAVAVKVIDPFGAALAMGGTGQKRICIRWRGVRSFRDSEWR